ncbi:MAG: 50S ribosomal protein L5 [Phycisphaerae bacterium]
MTPVARLRQIYQTEVLPALIAELKRSNRLSIPRLDKVVVSMGVGRSITEKNLLEKAGKELATITGQRPVTCRARKSVSNFKLRKGMPIGLKVTLRGNRMYEFLDRLISVAIPRVRDFRGLNPKSFDGRGNFHLGLSEQTVFPEVNPDQVEFQLGMNITICTTAGSDSEGLRLLTLLGMPFRSSASSASSAA